MRRRDIFRTILAAAGASSLAPRRAGAANDANAPKVAYHLSDADRANFVLGNIRNHYEGTGGKTTIALVVHGPALAAFRATSASRVVANSFAGLQKHGLTAHACATTMHGMDLSITDLLPGFVVAEKGGVVKLAELQREGYAYLRP
jgi:intracellular sulfur oxidation DsrE/DsrF family protein